MGLKLVELGFAITKKTDVLTKTLTMHSSTSFELQSKNKHLSELVEKLRATLSSNAKKAEDDEKKVLVKHDENSIVIDKPTCSSSTIFDHNNR